MCSRSSIILARLLPSQSALKSHYNDKGSVYRMLLHLPQRPSLPLDHVMEGWGFLHEFSSPPPPAIDHSRPPASHLSLPASCLPSRLSAILLMMARKVAASSPDMANVPPGTCSQAWANIITSIITFTIVIIIVLIITIKIHIVLT